MVDGDNQPVGKPVGVQGGRMGGILRLEGRVSVPSRLARWGLIAVMALIVATACQESGSTTPSEDVTPDSTTVSASSTTEADVVAANGFDPAPSEPALASVETIELPEGFEMSVFASNVSGARSMTLGADGTVFVGSRQPGMLYALVDSDGDFAADDGFILDRGMNSPNGVAYRDGALFVAEIDRVLRYDDIESSLADPPAPAVVNDAFPTDGRHGWKFIRFGPDGDLYVPVGAPCNACQLSAEMFGTIMRMHPDGSGLEVFASGVRNSVGFDWHPETDELWFTDNGRDELGDDVPPDELNHAPEAGLHFGFPYCHGGTVPDPIYGSDGSCDEFVAPAMPLGPHVAALGMRFYTGQMFPDEYRGQVLIAEHGSWNRSVPIGYRVTLVRINESDAVSYEVFADGWLTDDGAWGRPVDLLVMPDGSLLVSDDKGNAIYRISYTGEA